jgi:hypothetical protein
LSNKQRLGLLRLTIIFDGLIFVTNLFIVAGVIRHW